MNNEEMLGVIIFILFIVNAIVQTITIYRLRNERRLLRAEIQIRIIADAVGIKYKNFIGSKAGTMKEMITVEVNER